MIEEGEEEAMSGMGSPQREHRKKSKYNDDGSEVRN